MGFFGKLSGGYTIETYCKNCMDKVWLKVPRGIYVYDFLRDERCICTNCGCRIRSIEGNDEIDPESLEQEHKKQLMSLKERLSRKK